jgi:hypothetical protein
MDGMTVDRLPLAPPSGTHLGQITRSSSSTNTSIMRRGFASFELCPPQSDAGRNDPCDSHLLPPTAAPKSAALTTLTQSPIETWSRCSGWRFNGEAYVATMRDTAAAVYRLPSTVTWP